ncbi:MAG: T9SS type A sorting domain-containing protein [Bacteroidales bacterium]
MKIKPIQKRYYCNNIADDDHLIYTGINNLKVHFTKWGLHWNSNSSNNQKWEDAAFVWKDFNNDNTQCEWEQVYYEITVPSGKTDLKNMILYCSEGGFLIDDVELNEKCPTTIYFQNHEFNIPNRPYAYFADDKIVAGKNVTTATENGDVVVNQNGKVNFIAGNEVRLKHGFRTNGGEFHAFNQNCYSSKSTMSERNEINDRKNTAKHENISINISPNPFTTATTITFGLQQPSDVNIYITNSYGQKAHHVYNNFTEAGNYDVKLNGSGLQPGLYFCIMETQSSREVIKMVKM